MSFGLDFDLSEFEENLGFDTTKCIEFTDKMISLTSS